MPYTKKNGDGKTAVDWGKIVESLIAGIVLVVVLGAFNWFLLVRDLRQDNRILRKDMKHGMVLLGTQQSMVGKTMWSHIHPKGDVPCPWPEIDFSYMDIDNDKEK